MGDGVRTFLAAVLGGIVGILVVGAVGYGVGAGYVAIFMPDAGLEGLLPPLIGTVVGGSIGGIAGISSGIVYTRRDRREPRD